MKALDRDATASMRGDAPGQTAQNDTASGPIRPNDGFFEKQLSAANAPQKTSSASTPSAGDVVEPILNIAGGALMGGPIGALTALAGEVFEAVSGDSILGHVASLFTGEATAPTAVAQANRAYLNAGGLARTP